MMIPPFVIRLFQLNWFLTLCFALLMGLLSEYTRTLIYAIMTLGWAVVIQKFSDGEDLIYNFFHKLRKGK